MKPDIKNANFSSVNTLLFCFLHLLTPGPNLPPLPQCVSPPVWWLSKPLLTNFRTEQSEGFQRASIRQSCLAMHYAVKELRQKHASQFPV